MQALADRLITFLAHYHEDGGDNKLKPEAAPAAWRWPGAAVNSGQRPAQPSVSALISTFAKLTKT